MAIFILSGCEKEPLQFFPQDELLKQSDLKLGFVSEDELTHETSYDYDINVVVVVSLPQDNLQAIKAVDQYISQNYNEQELLKYHHFRLLFFRESWDTNRIYKPLSEYIDYQRGLSSYVPAFNQDDVILEVDWQRKIQKGKPWAFRMYNFRNDFGNDCPYRAMFWLDDKTYRFHNSCSTEQRQAVEEYFKGARADKIW